MSLKSVFNKLEEIASVSSTLAKEELLAIYLHDNSLFLKVVQYTLDPRKKFYTKKLPAYNEKYSRGTPEQLFSMLGQLASQTGASNKDKQTLALIASTDKETWEVVRRICNADLRCGAGQRMINKVRPNTIPFTPYLRCSTIKQIHRIDFPAIWQIKANGMYDEMIVHSNKVVFNTRDSKKVKRLGHLKRGFKGTVPKGHMRACVYMGEMRVWNTDGTIMSRQKGNGVINQCIQGTVSKELAKRVFFSIWDAVPYADYKQEKCLIPYDKRLAEAQAVIGLIGNSKLFQIIESHEVKNLEEAQDLTNREIKKGNEGGVLKRKKATWKHGTSTEQVKMKARFEGELRAIRWEYGDKGKKHEHRMGRIMFETDDGFVRTWVGGGYSDAMREEDMEQHMGRIGELEYESLSESKSRKAGEPKYALYGPATFSCWRDDKDDTDTLKDLKDR